MSFESLHRSAREVLAAWRPSDPGQEPLRQAYLSYLLAVPDAMRRSCAPGHLTASAAVVNETRTRTLLTLHPRIGRWVQLGGHCEPDDESLPAAALREAREESGIPGVRLEPGPIQLDVHPLTCSGGVPTRHLDVRFLAVAADDAIEAISEESVELRWFALDELPGDLDAGTADLLRIALTGQISR